MADVRNGVAVITGAAGGLGGGLARVAAGRGMKLVLADRDEARLTAVVDALSAEGAEAIGVPTDVTDPAALDRLAAKAKERFGAVTLLINNAGIETLGLSWELPAETWQRAIGVNLLGVIYGVRAFAPGMLAEGKPAHIVNIASLAALGMMPITAPYMVTKHAVLAFTECLKLEMDVKAAPITVSAVLPGAIATPIFTDAPGVDGDPMVAAHRAIMGEMLAQGLSPDEAADRIFAQLDEGRFWVSPHPEMLAEMADDRAAYLSARSAPELREGHRHMLAI
ncbi:SDR family NAD(P)-dependent oxidoreductase [Flavisphingomonas formosensis]|uniref:SDR family NAD(P)-dependent oxidoreductase n=1 Tax=Flavisphingomonas formosensis TaxID=861534 RepID=UPI0012F79300|nr:SDR family NAD(P)-dependent oxidoreductase [Sphingomonas formosensis]